ncbi:MAG TPA: hypothetical protein VFT36_09000 [Methylomirabilota bacterium]|nr:hypothetical protein [Methylomirabilota bacterium]
MNPRPLVALAFALIAVALFAGVAHGGSPWPVDPSVEERPSGLPPWLIASRLGRPLDEAPREDVTAAGGLGDLDAVLLRDTPPSIEEVPLTLRTSNAADSADLRTLLGGGDRWHLMRFGAAAGSPHEVKMTAYGTVAYLPSTVIASRPDAGLGYGPVATTQWVEDRGEPISLGFRAQLEGLEGGAEYRSIGKHLEPVVSGTVSQRDREGSEVWVAQRLGLLRIKLSQSDLTDNVDLDPAVPRTNRTQTAIGAQIAPRGWPILGLAYATGDLERTWLTGQGRPRAVERQTFDSLTASLYYSTSVFDVSGSSVYSYSRDPGGADREMASLYHDLTLTLRPLRTVTLMPSMSTGTDRYEWSSDEYRTATMSVFCTYTPVASRWKAWTLGAYSTSQATDRTVDARSMSVSGGLAYELGRLLGGRASVSVEAGYDRYVDSAYPAASRGAFGLVLLKLTSS